MTTPFQNGELDLSGVHDNVRRWMATPLAGIVVLGTNGESAYIDDDESERLIAAVRDEVPGERLVIAGTGRDSTRATMAACARAAQAGADMVLVRTPAFFKNQMTAEALIRHYTAVADVSPVPVLLYNFPAVFGVDLPTAAVERLAAHANIVGIKESGGDVAKISDDVARTHPGFTVYCGSATVLFASVMAGADGAILAVACVVPDLCVELYELSRTGRHDEARELQRRLTPLARSVTTTFGVPGLKAAMDLAGFVGGEPREPLLPVRPEARAVIRAQMKELGVLAEA